MSDEFVDFYEVLTLPLDADRSTIRKRINEMYVEAQRNLDHRNFATRVKYQELFEIKLPQARYILLDEGRRDDYDRLVTSARASGAVPTARAAPKSAPAVATELGQNSASAAAGAAQIGAAPSIDALPKNLDPAAAAREREELWNKWKTGLQSAMEREGAEQTHQGAAEQARQGAPAAPRPDTLRAETQSAPAQNSAPASNPARRPERPKVKFDFGGAGQAAPAPNASMLGASISGAPMPTAPGAPELSEEAAARLSPEEVERRRTQHRREVMREELDHVNVQGWAIGAAAVLVPGVIIMVLFMSRFYPAGQESELAIKNPAISWLLWLTVLAVGAALAAIYTARSMRRKRSMELTLMSYEDLMRLGHRR